MNRPFFTVLIPTCNRAGFLRNCLDSLLQQDLADTEIIVGDNASTDDTAEVVKRYGSIVTRYVRHPQNLGALGNIGALGTMATGRYVVLHQDDDYLAPFFLHECRKLLERHPSATMFCTPMWDGVPARRLSSSMPGYLLSALMPHAVAGSSYMLAPGGLGTALFLFSTYANPPAVALSADALAKGDGFVCDAAGGGADILAAARALHHGDVIYYPFTGCTHTLHEGNFCKERSRQDRRGALRTIICRVMDEMRKRPTDWQADVLHLLSGMEYSERCRHYRRFLKYNAPADLMAIVRTECQPRSPRQFLAFARALGCSGLAGHLRTGGKAAPTDEGRTRG